MRGTLQTRDGTGIVWYSVSVLGVLAVAIGIHLFYRGTPALPHTPWDDDITIIPTVTHVPHVVVLQSTILAGENVSLVHELLAPLSPGQFLGSIFENRPVHIQARAPKFTQNFLTEAQIDSLVEHGSTVERASKAPMQNLKVRSGLLYCA